MRRQIRAKSDACIDTLQNEQVTKFVEDVASNLPKYGLDKPQLQIDLQFIRLGEHCRNQSWRAALCDDRVWKSGWR